VTRFCDGTVDRLPHPQSLVVFWLLGPGMMRVRKIGPRVPVAGEVVECLGEEWTVGIVRWVEVGHLMEPAVNLYKEAKNGQRGPIKPPLGPIPTLDEEPEKPKRARARRKGVLDG
jgi:hypothetical protein